MNERERIVGALRSLRGEESETSKGPDGLPWATRLDVWHTSRLRTQTLPTEVAGMDLMAIHRYAGIGRQCYANLVTTRLRGVELIAHFNGTLIHRETDPRVSSFPIAREYAISDKPGDSIVTLKTPMGAVRTGYRTTEELIRGAAASYVCEHPVKDDDDAKVVGWILEHAEAEPNYEEFVAREAMVGDEGFTIGQMGRVPLQRLLLDVMGEERGFYAMADNPRGVQYLLDALTADNEAIVELALRSPALMIEFGDNFEGMITSPRLFQQYVIPYLQGVSERMHATGRFLGSHMDGNMKPLLDLVPETGLDVVESFSACALLTQLTFAEAWRAWRGKVLMWGAIPSPIFEAPVAEHDFEDWMHQMIELIGDDGRIILGIGDQAVGPTLLERVRRVSEMLGRRV